MGKKSSNTVSMDPAIGQAMTRMAELSEKQQAWYENTIYPWLQTQTEKSNQATQDALDFEKENAQWYKNYYTEQSDRQNAKSDELYERYQTLYKPIEDQLIEEANSYDSGKQAKTDAADAMSTTSGAYNAQRDALKMRMKAYGLDSTSDLYSNQARASGVNEAAASVSAANEARQAAVDLGWQKQLQIASLGSTYLGNTIDLSSLANNTVATGSTNTTNNAAASVSSNNQAVQNVSSLANIGLSSYQNMANAWGQYGNMGQQQQSYNQSVANAKSAAKANETSGYVAAAGTVAAIGIAI